MGVITRAKPFLADISKLCSLEQRGGKNFCYKEYDPPVLGSNRRSSNCTSDASASELFLCEGDSLYELLHMSYPYPNVFDNYTLVSIYIQQNFKTTSK